MLDFRVFGATELFTSAGRSASSVLAQPKRVAILTYLALAMPRGFHRRATLLALFWPESDESHARHALNQALYHLRQSLGEDALVSRNDEEIGLDWDRFSCDAVRFRVALAADQLEEAVGLYRGELLPGFHIDAAPEFDMWLEDQRRASRQAALAAALELAGRAESAGDAVKAGDWLQRACAIAPYEETAVRRRMELLQRGDNGADALRAFEAYAARLAAELETTPSAALRTLAEEIRSAVAARTQSRTDVSVSSRSPAPAAARREAGAREVAVSGAGAASDVAAATHPMAGRRRLLLAALAAIALVSAITAASLMPRLGVGPGAPLVAGDMGEDVALILAEFTNHTAEPRLGTVLTEALRADLKQSAVIRVADAEQVRETLEQMRLPPNTTLEPAIAREVAVRAGIEVMLQNSVGRAGAGYVLTADLIAPEDGSTLAAFHVNAAGPDAVIAAIGRLSRQIRRKLGESAGLIRASTPLPQATTPYLDALLRYTEAYRTVDPCAPDCNTRFETLMLEAIAIDTAFGMAYRGLGNALYNLGMRQRAALYLTKAYQLRHRMTLEERYETEAIYHYRVTGDVEKAITAYNVILNMSDGDDRKAFGALEHLGNLYYGQRPYEARDYERAAEMWRRRARMPALRPDGVGAPYAYTYWAEALTAQGKWLEARSVLRQADSIYHTFSGRLAQIAYVLRGTRAVDSALLAWADHLQRTGAPSGEARWFVSRHRSALAAVDGRLRDAEQLTVQSRREGMKAMAAARHLALVDQYVRLDPVAALSRLDTVFTRQRLDSLPPLERPYDLLIAVHSRAGQVQQAKAYLAEFNREVPDSIRRMSVAHAGTRSSLGELALAEARFHDAVRHFRQARDDRTCVICALPDLGSAYEAAGQPDSAIVVYEQYLSARSDIHRLLLDEYYLASILERLAALKEQRGDMRGAAASYERFIELWQHADPELQPRVQRARERLARMSVPRPPRSSLTK